MNASIKERGQTGWIARCSFCNKIHHSASEKHLLPTKIFCECEGYKIGAPLKRK